MSLMTDAPPASRLHPTSGAPIPPPGWTRCPLVSERGWTAVHAHEEGDRQHAGCHLAPTLLRRLGFALGWL